MYSTTSLKLYAFGINLLHDPNWTSGELYDNIKQYTRHRIEPYGLLSKTIKNGLLYHLGVWIYEQYFEDEERFENYLDIEDEQLLWYIEDFLEFLYGSGIEKNNILISEVYAYVVYLEKLYDINEQDYYNILKDRNKLISHAINLSTAFADQIREKKAEYAYEFAERLFHDRAICDYISKLIVIIGFDGTNNDEEEPISWIRRERLPNWAKRAIISRDRGKCANCGKNLILELEDDYHFDHIISLSIGGTNDLSNFQLLCKVCNLEKSNSIIPIESSIPNYFRRKFQ